MHYFHLARASALVDNWTSAAYWLGRSQRDDPRYRKLMQEVKADVARQRAEVEALGPEENFIAELDAVMAARVRWSELSAQTSDTVISGVTSGASGVDVLPVIRSVQGTGG